MRRCSRMSRDARVRQIQSGFWTHPDIRSLSVHGKLLAAYLLTCRHANGIGCFYLPAGYVEADLIWLSETVSKGFAELFDNGVLKRCERTEFAFIPNFLRWNPIANGNVAKARYNELLDIPKDLSYFNELLKSCNRFGNHWPNGFEALSKRYGKQDPHPDPDPDPDPEPGRSPSARPPARTRPDARPPSPDLDHLKSLYPERAGAQPWSRALRAANAQIKDGATWEELLDGVSRYAVYCRETGKVGTEFVMQAATFLGPECHFRQPWRPPPTESEQRLRDNIAAAERAMEVLAERDRLEVSHDRS